MRTLDSHQVSLNVKLRMERGEHALQVLMERGEGEKEKRRKIKHEILEKGVREILRDRWK